MRYPLIALFVLLTVISVVILIRKDHLREQSEREQTQRHIRALYVAVGVTPVDAGLDTMRDQAMRIGPRKMNTVEGYRLYEIIEPVDPDSVMGQTILANMNETISGRYVLRLWLRHHDRMDLYPR